MKKKLMKIIVMMLVMALSMPIYTFAQTYDKQIIKNNGLNAIYIDIGKSPYTNMNYNNSAYSKLGCGWFASARVRELTGKGSTVRNGVGWMKHYSEYGFAKGNTAPSVKAIACYSNHVSVIEAYDGKTYTVSEGGNQSGSASEGYCQITTRTLSQIMNLNGSSGSFLGFVYLGVPFSQTDKEKPAISNALVTNITATGFDVSCIAKDNVGVQRVAFPTWTERNGQDDIIWHEGIHKDGRWSCHINVSQHKGETGTYITHVYAYDKAGNSSMTGIGEYTVGMYANDVKLNKTAVELNIGDSMAISATVYPLNAVDKAIKWSSSDISVATVSNGRIQAVGEGTATIKASLGYIPVDGNWYATCMVKVKGVIPEEKSASADIYEETPEEKKDASKINPIEIKEDVNPSESEVEMNTDDADTDEDSWSYATRADITLGKHSLQMELGDTDTLSAYVIPANAVKDSLNWISSNPSVATVDNGVIKAVGAGTTIIRVNFGCVPPEGRWQDQCTVTVTDMSRQESYYKNNSMSYENKSESSRSKTNVNRAGIVIGGKVYPTDVYLNAYSLNISVDEVYTLNATINPENATERELQWGSSNENVAVVSNGTVTAVGPGTAKITVSLSHAFADSMARKSWYAVCEVTVTE